MTTLIFDFTVDDNGLQLVKDVLSREQIPTFGVDLTYFVVQLV